MLRPIARGQPLPKMLAPNLVRVCGGPPHRSANLSTAVALAGPIDVVSRLLSQRTAGPIPIAKASHGHTHSAMYAIVVRDLHRFRQRFRKHFQPGAIRRRPSFAAD